MSPSTVVAEDKFNPDCPIAALVRVLSRVSGDEFECVYAEIEPSVIAEVVSWQAGSRLRFEYQGHVVEVSDDSITVYDSH